VTTAVLSAAGNDATGTELGAPTAAVPTPDGGFLVTDYAKCTVSKVKDGLIAPVAGNGTCWPGSGPVDCPSTSFCMAAVSNDGVAFTTNPTAAKPSWTVSLGLPKSEHALITGISCASASLCAMTDNHGDVISSANPTGGAGTWHLKNVVSQFSGLYGIDCPSTSLCVVAANDQSIYVSANPTLGDTATWTHYDLGMTARGVDCTSPTLCIAFGRATSPSNTAKVAIATDPANGADKWQTATFTSVPSVDDATCVTATLCVGFDVVGVGTQKLISSINPTDGSTWGAADVTGSFVHELSCPSASFCAATDLSGRILSSTTPTNASSWSITNTTAAGGTQQFCSSELQYHCSVACPSTSFCMASGTMQTIASTAPASANWKATDQADGAVATSASLSHPGDAVPTQDGGFLLIEGGLPQTGLHTVRKVSSSGQITRIAGTGTATGGSFPNGDGGPADAARVEGTAVVPYHAPGGAVDTPGTGYLIAESTNCTVRKVDGGVITTVAGTGTCGFGGDGGNATAASLDTPISAVPTADGGFLVAEFGNLFFQTGGRIRKVGTDGKINTVAGTGSPGYSGDGGPATAAQLYRPTSAVPTAGGGFLIADWGNNVVRKVTAAGIISTVAGNGTAGQDGDGGAATAAQLTGPTAAVATPDGGFLLGSYAAGATKLVVRKVSAAGTIVTVAGTTTGAPGDPQPPGGDGDPGTGGTPTDTTPNPPPPTDTTPNPPSPKPKPKCSFKSAKLRTVRKKPAVIAATIVCDQAANVKLGGTVKRKIRKKTKKYALAAQKAKAVALVPKVIVLRLPKGVLAGLKRGDKQSAALKLAASNANGSSTANATIKKLATKRR
jgi:hypothetical protein